MTPPVRLSRDRGELVSVLSIIGNNIAELPRLSRRTKPAKCAGLVGPGCKARQVPVSEMI